MTIKAGNGYLIEYTYIGQQCECNLSSFDEVKIDKRIPEIAINPKYIKVIFTR